MSGCEGGMFFVLYGGEIMEKKALQGGTSAMIH